MFIFEATFLVIVHLQQQGLVYILQSFFSNNVVLTDFKRLFFT